MSASQSLGATSENPSKSANATLASPSWVRLYARDGTLDQSELMAKKISF